jgi:high-affinity Fe2+/Pb2+ permease
MLSKLEIQLESGTTRYSSLLLVVLLLRQPRRLPLNPVLLLSHLFSVYLAFKLFADIISSLQVAQHLRITNALLPL